MESGVSGQQFSRRVNRAYEASCAQVSRLFVFVIVVYPFSFIERFCCSKKEANSFIAGSLRTARVRRQGRRCLPFIGEKRKTLDGRSAGKTGRSLLRRRGFAVELF